jgi:hypothetical protein
LEIVQNISNYSFPFLNLRKNLIFHNPLLVLHESFWRLNKGVELKILQRTTHHLFSTLEVLFINSIFLEQLGVQVSSGAVEFVDVAEL